MLFPRRNLAAGLATCLLVTVFVVEASAHAFWLVPFPKAAEVGRTIALDLRVGQKWPGKATPRLEGLVDQFYVLNGAQKTEVSGREGVRPIGHATVNEAAAAVFVLRTFPFQTALNGAKFTTYLHEEGLRNIINLRAANNISDQPEREQFSRCAKVVVPVGGNADGFDRVVGMPLELVPLTNPVTSEAKDRFLVQLMANGHGIHGQVRAMSKDKPELIFTGRTGEDGRITFHLPRGGLWTFYSVRMKPSEQTDIDYESLWASLTVDIS